MPLIAHGNQGSNLDLSVFEDKIKYEYPDGLNFKPSSRLHRKIKNFILEKAQASYNRIETKFDSWNEIDRTLTAYIPEDIKDDEKNRTKSNPIIVPLSYTNMETLLTYMVATFIQSPIFRYEGNGPEDEIGAIKLQQLISLHAQRMGMGLNLHTSWRDNFAYGFGVIAPTWETIYGKKTVIKEETFFSSIMNKIIKTGNIEKSVEDVIRFEGNKLNNIEPYRYLPDVNVPINDVQSGEYVGWVERTNIMDLLTREENSGGDIFNVEFLRKINYAVSNIVPDNSSERNRESRSVLRSNMSLSVTKPVDIIHMYVKIIPKDLKLGSSKYPEKWLFSIAADEIIIQARPLGLDHDMFPVSVCSSEYDGYSTNPTSKLEMLYGLQSTADWLFSSHIANVRKAINDMLIVDPSIININDLMSPRPGKLLRIRKNYWGRGLINDAVKQLPVNDITSGHIRDTSFISDLMKITSGAVDSLQGIMRSGGERRSATEARGARVSALSRLEKSAKVIHMQQMQPLAYMLAYHTQQLMDQETYVKSSGEFDEELLAEYGIDVKRDRVAISPKDINVDFDVVPHDGSMPGGEPPDLWIQLYQVLSTNPEMSQAFDVVRIFKHVARQLGAKNVNDFVRKGGQVNVQTMSNEDVLKQADKGNIVPLK